MPVTQFNMKWVEPAGLVKFDFLGLKTLTVLARARTPRRPWREIDLERLPLDDQATYEMLGTAARRPACSSWNQRACATLCGDLKPDRFEDIIALVALYRPGPMENIPSYINRKHGQEEPPTICTTRWNRSSRRPTASSSTRNR